VCKYVTITYKELSLQNGELKKMDKIKNNKLEQIASIFEGWTCANFDVCCEDLGFRKLLIKNANEPLTNVASMLTDYANENLI